MALTANLKYETKGNKENFGGDKASSSKLIGYVLVLLLHFISVMGNKGLGKIHKANAYVSFF